MRQTGRSLRVLASWWALNAHGLTASPIVRAVRRRRLTYLDPRALTELEQTVRTLESAQVPGLFIEAGTALGGSAIVITSAKATDRPLLLFDVFGLIPPPSERDGHDVHRRFEEIRAGKSGGLGGDLYYGYLPDLKVRVRSAFADLGFPVDHNTVRLVEGLFEDTLRVEEPVAFAHIDCDWYASVMTCLERIEPRLVTGGVLVIDDYDHWSGCRAAVDEYFADKRDRFRFVRRSRLHIVCAVPV